MRNDRFDRGDIFSRRFHRRFFFGPGRGFLGYGFGLFSDCPTWLVLDWEWDENYADCDISDQQQFGSIIAYGADQNYDYGAPQPDTQQIYGAYASQNPPALAARQSDSTNENEAASVGVAREAARDTLIYLADGSNYAVTSYWLAGGELHYVTNYGAEDSVPIGQIDLQRTVDANAVQGVQFTLRPAPSSDSGSGR